MRTMIAQLGAILALGLSLTQSVSAATTTLPQRAPMPPLGQTVTYTYRTFLGPQRFGLGSVGDLNEDFGTMTLTFNANNIISGTYKPEFGPFTPVTGGRDGKNFHISFGSRGQFLLQGHFTRHGIVGTTSAFGPSGTYWQLYGQFQHA